MRCKMVWYQASLGRDWKGHLHITQVLSPEQVGRPANRIEQG